VETALPPDPESAPEPALESPAAIAPVTPVAAVPPLPAVPVYELPAYPDRRTGLIIFGVFQIILGLLAALMVPLMALGAVVSHLTPGGAMRPGQIVSGVATYAFIAATLLALGIGSIQSRRWARALTLVTSWYWLVLGVLGTVLITAMLPVMMRSVLAQMKQAGADAPSPEMSTGVMAVILTLFILAAAFFLILVPLAFVIFYSREDVAETCRHRDPVPRWTDRTPLPVLGASVAIFGGALYMLLIGLTTPIFPFFGRYLTGFAGAACFLVLGVLDFYISIALFRLQQSGWWLATVALAVRTLSTVLTFSRADLMQAYSKTGLSDAQLQMLNSNPMFRGHVLLWWNLLSMLMFFGYLIWLKRYFRPAIPTANEIPAPTIQSS
jgi:hypothetical protein